MNLEDAFRNTPTNMNNTNSFGAKRTTKGEEQGSEEKTNKQTTTTEKSKASQNKMPSEMWQEYLKYPENTKKLPARIDGMRRWCAKNGICFLCYSESCRKSAKDENLSEADREASKTKCKNITKKEGLCSEGTCGGSNDL